MQDLRPCSEFLFGREPVELEPPGADRLDVLRPGIDQGDVVPEMGEVAADIPAERARAHDRDAFCHGENHKG